MIRLLSVKEVFSNFNIEYLDYSFHHNLDTRFDFYDSRHLNQSGVEKFNSILIADLKAKEYIK